jgi:hypothetical protein
VSAVRKRRRSPRDVWSAAPRRCAKRSVRAEMVISRRIERPRRATHGRVEVALTGADEFSCRDRAIDVTRDSRERARPPTKRMVSRFDSATPIDRLPLPPSRRISGQAHACAPQAARWCKTERRVRCARSRVSPCKANAGQRCPRRVQCFRRRRAVRVSDDPIQRRPCDGVSSA